MMYRNSIILFCFSCLILSGCQSAPPEFADAIWYNGEILTMEGDSPEIVAAIAVKGAKIISVGTWAHVKKFKGEQTLVHDLQGKTMMPGLVDSHSHLAVMALLWRSVNLASPPVGDISNLEQLLSKLSGAIEESRPRVLFASQYDELLLEEKRHPTRAELDAISTDIPIILLHTSMHMGVANTKALEMVGMLKAGAQDPPGGKFGRETSGQLTGIFEEQAVFSFVPILPIPKGPDAIQVLEEILEYYMSNGFTTAQEGHAQKGNYLLLKAAAEQGLLPIDVVAYLKWREFGDLNKEYDLQVGKYVNRLKVGGVKIIQDGSPQIKTAYLSQPFHICPPHGACSGYSIMPYDEFSKYIKEFHENNVQTIVHCNGDSAIGMMIRAVREAELNKGKRDLRFSIVHSQTIRQDQLDAVKELNLYPTFFPSHTFYWGDWHRESVLGEARAMQISPVRSALDRGIIFGIHTDAPVIPLNQFDAIQRSVLRQTRSGFVLGADERIDVYTGLQASTIWGAYMYHEENKKGSIRPGKLADLIILDQNPLKVPIEELKDIVVLETIKEGKTVYKRK
jgi:predicted amidohydrolase YtcJ